MKLLSSTPDTNIIELTVEESRIICQALNEICHGNRLPHFHTRMGATVEEVSRLLDDVGVLRRKPRPSRRDQP